MLIMYRYYEIMPVIWCDCHKYNDIAKADCGIKLIIHQLIEKSARSIPLQNDKYLNGFDVPPKIIFICIT